MKSLERRSREERFNTFTHLAGVVFTLIAAWSILRLGYRGHWQYAFGTTFFTCGMLLMYAASTLYHWALPGRTKRVLRVLDHISIYVMIAASYTPICIGVVGGWVGWLVFGVLWAMVIGGTVYKIVAIDRWPRLSLLLYLAMGWCVLFIFPTVVSHLSKLSIVLLLCEGFFYTAGTYFFANDSRRHFHAVWHIFVLLGAMSHWSVVLTILL